MTGADWLVLRTPPETIEVSMTDEEKTRAMRALPDDQRRELINEAPNVIGFDRFTQKAQQVALRDAYRAPQKPGSGGTA